MAVLPTQGVSKRLLDFARPLWGELLKIEAELEKLKDQREVLELESPQAASQLREQREDWQLAKVLKLEYQASRLRLSLTSAFGKTLAEFKSVRVVLVQMFGEDFAVQEQSA